MVLAPEIPPRSKPVEAMVECGVLPMLPIVITDMDTEEALKTILRIKITSDTVFRQCAARNNEMIRWINDDE